MNCRCTCTLHSMGSVSRRERLLGAVRMAASSNVPPPHPPCNDLVLVNLGFKNLPGHSGVLAQVELLHPCT